MLKKRNADQRGIRSHRSVDFILLFFNKTEEFPIIKEIIKYDQPIR